MSEQGEVQDKELEAMTQVIKGLRLIGTAFESLDSEPAQRDLYAYTAGRFGRTVAAYKPPPIGKGKASVAAIDGRRRTA